MDKDYIEQNIWINMEGQLVIESILGKVDSKLIACIEDNIEIVDVDCEKIAWNKVWKDYELEKA